MNKAELATTEEIVLDVTEDVAVALSLPELDMVGGGQMGSLLL